MLWIAEVDLQKDFKSNCSGFFSSFFTILFYYFFFLFYVLFPSRRIFLGSRLFLFSFTYNSIQYNFFFISVNEHIFLHVFHVLTPKTRISYNYIWSKYVVYLEHWDTSSDTAYVDVFTLHVPTFSLMYFFFRWKWYHIACSYMHI